MWLKKVKHKKLQFCLTGIMLFAVSGLLNMCICLTGELASFSDKAINEQNCPDGYILTIGSKNFQDNFENNLYENEVNSVSALIGKAVTAPIKYNGKDIAQLYDMMLSADGWRNFGYLELRSGNTNANSPAQG